MLKKYLKQLIQFIIFSVAGISILVLMYRNQSANYLAECTAKGLPAGDCSLKEKIINDFKSADELWIVVIVVLFMVSNVLRALRWNQLFEAIGHKVKFKNTFMATMIGYFANLGFPRFGEIIKSSILSKYEKVGIEKVLGTVVTDRLIDVLMLFSIILLALVLEFQVLWSFMEANLSIGGKLEIFQSHPFITGGIIVLAIFISTILFFRLRSSSSPFVVRAKKLINGFIQGLLSIKNLQSPGIFIFYTFSIWFLYYLMTYLCFFAFNPTNDLGPRAGLLTFVFGSLGIVFPSPGGMGSYHFLIVEALKLYKVNAADAFSFANILFFTIQIFCNIFFGILSLIFISVLNKKNEAN